MLPDSYGLMPDCLMIGCEEVYCQVCAKLMSIHPVRVSVQARRGVAGGAAGVGSEARCVMRRASGNNCPHARVSFGGGT
ncbi:MAG: hypothetical protein HQL99_08145 [Magnetococcales bacterium]|nr:hypothetical protein [Magnetococcales bacterium]